MRRNTGRLSRAGLRVPVGRARRAGVPLVVGLLTGSMLLAGPAAADPLPAAAGLSEFSYAGPDSTDFIEVYAEPGTDLGGWVVGSITRGDAPHTPAHVVTVPDDTVVPDSGVAAIDVPITNSTSGGYGSSVFVVDGDGALLDFWTVGSRNGGGSTAGSSSLLPESVRGQTAEPTNVLAPSGQSIQWVDDAWTAATPTKGEPNGSGSGGPGDPPDEDTHTIAQIQGEGDVTPVDGQTVTTSGVVTAAYPTGGFNGYYIQTPGTGDEPERTASDAIFVYSPATVGAVEIDDYVRVTGVASEYNGLTEITVESGGLTVLDEPAEAVKAVDFALPATDEGREVYEGMLVSPVAGYTVSDTYNLGGWGNNAFGSIGIGFGGPLVQETDLAPPGTSEYDDIVADNQARAVTLDDGRSARTSTDAEVPYLTATSGVRTGAESTFVDDVIFDYRFQWNFQPRFPVDGAASDVVTFLGGNTRATNAEPEDVGGDVRLATFNVLNYFTTLGVDLPGCQAYTDRDGNPISVRGGCDARGAWDAENLARQEGKIVAAINALKADVVGLEEIENSVAFGKDRDAALADLVAALNADTGENTWAYAASPADLPDLADQDVIRNAFIYRPAAVTPVGDSVVLIDSPAFHNAREPLAQVFEPVDGEGAFVAVVNHFKSKGGNCGDPAPPEGCFDADRVLQAEALVTFADDVATDAGVDDVFLIGDFNAYSAENPVRSLEDAGYVNLNPGEPTYVFGGKVGSLDHVFANESAAERVTGADVWRVNADESVLTEYSRFNYFASDLFEAGTVYRASDHNPILVGLAVAASGPTCGGFEATIVGTEGRDVLRGTPGRDVIVGLGGNDVILGLGGDDVLCGGDGDDVIIGGTGDDVIYGGTGNDVLIGGSGVNTIDDGGTGRNIVIP